MGSILFPDNSILQLTFDFLFGNEAWFRDLFEVVLTNRYLNDRSPPLPHGSFDIDRMFEMRDDDFKQAVRITKDAFVWLLGQIYHHAVFHSSSFRQQLPLPHQLALTLERLGSNGNGASVGKFA
ncbi:hypothetical protein PGTUg99_050035 [Puccinia graminis f. sp. tritici]|uniref:Uncharacterized protein n=1 Tax=Puccinia graminis f. sp. tritici TaxID=56615 RepID=A0A5B0RXG2_PUCGR|nr:hypothetical protein PGTUg99_050035 [Puccinia graminis f. sp. tritici]